MNINGLNKCIIEYECINNIKAFIKRNINNNNELKIR